MNEKLLREYVQECLHEDATYGISIKPQRLIDTFVTPLLDVFRTSRAEVEKLSAINPA